MSEYDDYASYDDGGEVADVYFPDGSTITDPYEDALGQVYETQQDWVDGSDPYEITGYWGDTALAE
jgi:hypothetical protein